MQRRGGDAACHSDPPPLSPLSPQLIEAEAAAANIACAIEEQALLNDRGEAAADALAAEVLDLTSLVATNGAALDAQVQWITSAVDKENPPTPD